VETIADDVKSGYAEQDISPAWYSRFRMSYGRLYNSYNALIDRIVASSLETDSSANTDSFQNEFDRVTNNVVLTVGMPDYWLPSLRGEGEQGDEFDNLVSIASNIMSLSTAIELIVTYKVAMNPDDWLRVVEFAVEELEGVKLVDFESASGK
jgi:hypothetical protein